MSYKEVHAKDGDILTPSHRSSLARPVAKVKDSSCARSGVRKRASCVDHPTGNIPKINPVAISCGNE